MRSIRLNGQVLTPMDLMTRSLKDLPEWEQEIFRFLKDWWSDAPNIMVNTSGSTGEPQEIKLPKSLMRASAQKTGAYLDWPVDMSALLAIPVRYIAGKMMIIRALEFDIHLDYVEPKVRITTDNEYSFAALTPLQAANSPDVLDATEQVLIGGGEIPPSLEKQLLQSYATIWHTYGMTETASHVALRNLGNEYFEALPGIDFAQDDRGCLIITADHLKENLITNDLVELLSPVRFKWLGRVDNVINTGGVKVFPEALERKLETVIDVPFFIGSMNDSELGQKVILLLEGEGLNVSDVLAKAQTVLEGPERPRDAFQIKEFEYTGTGKIRRQETLVKALVG